MFGLGCLHGMVLLRHCLRPLPLTGRLVAEYFAKHVHDVPWAIGGRNAERLEGVRASIEREDIGIVVADSFSEEQLRAMARRAGVIITTVGPFLQYGERLVAACAEEGTGAVPDQRPRKVD